MDFETGRMILEMIVKFLLACVFIGAGFYLGTLGRRTKEAQKAQWALNEKVDRITETVPEYGTGVALVRYACDKLPLKDHWGEGTKFLYFQKGKKPDADYAEEFAGGYRFMKNQPAKVVRSDIPEHMNQGGGGMGVMPMAGGMRPHIAVVVTASSKAPGRVTIRGGSGGTKGKGTKGGGANNRN